MARKKEVVAMLLAGGQGTRLQVLTKDMAKPAVPFGGKYRIIDFPLSNCANSGISTVGVLTQFMPLELNSYMGNGQPWDLDRMDGGVTVLQPHTRKNDKKARHYYNYDLMKELNDGKQMKDVWTGPLTKISEKWAGKHPTQKPEYLLERIILASTKEGDYILDPFVGSGTTGVVAKRLGRKFIGIDAEKEYLKIARRRLEEENYG